MLPVLAISAFNALLASKEPKRGAGEAHRDGRRHLSPVWYNRLQLAIKHTGEEGQLIGRANGHGVQSVSSGVGGLEQASPQVNDVP